MIYMGIDPGLTGHIATIDGDQIQVMQIPRVGREIDEHALDGILRDYSTKSGRPTTRAVVEKQQSFPGQGVASSWRGGYGYGILIALLVCHRLPFEAVRPAQWRRMLGIQAPSKLKGAARKREIKARSISTARRLFPNVDLRRTPRCRVASHDRAEALLLAEVARRLNRR